MEHIHLEITPLQATIRARQTQTLRGRLQEAEAES